MRSDILHENSQQTGGKKLKVVNLTVAITLTNEDSGKVYAVDSAGGAYEITLPTSLEDGVYYKFIVWEETPTADVTIAAGSAIISGVNKDAGPNVTGIKNVFRQIRKEHEDGEGVKALDAYPATILPLLTFASVDDAKTAIMPSATTDLYDLHCDRQEWALVGDTGLKLTRDHNIENNSSNDAHAVVLEAAIQATNGGWITEGSVVTDSTDHIF